MLVPLLHPELDTERFWRQTMTREEYAKAIADYSAAMAIETFIECAPVVRQLELDLYKERRLELCQRSMTN